MARLDFLGTLLPILSVYYVGISKDIGKKVTTAVMYKDENFFMIHVLLASELSWQRNDAIVFFTCLCISQYLEGFLKSLKGACTSLSCLDYGKV